LGARKIRVNCINPGLIENRWGSHTRQRLQAFLKVPALHATAPTQTESPFKLTQLVVLALFVLLAVVAAIRLRPEPIRAT
jgi:NAD(P)-dependent dehydrogenase (short-subunit alcohol dehydrogenase family)